MLINLTWQNENKQKSNHNFLFIQNSLLCANITWTMIFTYKIQPPIIPIFIYWLFVIWLFVIYMCLYSTNEYLIYKLWILISIENYYFFAFLLPCHIYQLFCVCLLLLVLVRKVNEMFFLFVFGV